MLEKGLKRWLTLVLTDYSVYLHKTADIEYGLIDDDDQNRCFPCPDREKCHRSHQGSRSLNDHVRLYHSYKDKMEMARPFGHHGVDLSTDFDLHMVQVCALEQSAHSIPANLERAVLLLRFIVVFSRDDVTQVRMLRLGQKLVQELIDDDEFVSLNVAICDDLRCAIEKAL